MEIKAPNTPWTEPNMRISVLATDKNIPSFKIWNKCIFPWYVVQILIDFYSIGSRTIDRTLIPNLGYKALLFGIQFQDQGSKLQSRRNSCSKIL